MKIISIPTVIILMTISLSGRTWTDKQGREIDAELLSVSGSKIALKRKDGKRFTLNKDILSNSDQKYISDAKKNKEANEAFLKEKDKKQFKGYPKTFKSKHGHEVVVFAKAAQKEAKGSRDPFSNSVAKKSPHPPSSYVSFYIKRGNYDKIKEIKLPLSEYLPGDYKSVRSGVEWNSNEDAFCVYYTLEYKVETYTRTLKQMYSDLFIVNMDNLEKLASDADQSKERIEGMGKEISQLYSGYDVEAISDYVSSVLWQGTDSVKVNRVGKYIAYRGDNQKFENKKYSLIISK